MTIQISCSVPTLVAQKGRKLLVPTRIEVYQPSAIPGGAQCRVRVSFISCVPTAGVFSIQDIPGTWNAVNPPGAPAVVESTQFFDPNVSLPLFTAFPSFLDYNNASAPTLGYGATYKVEVFDNSQVYGSIQFVLSGSASPMRSVNVVFALDHGWSMAYTDASNSTRLDRLKAAFPRGVALLRSDDTLGVATFANFNSELTPQLAPGPATWTQRNAATTLADGLIVIPPQPIALKPIQIGIDAARALGPTATLVLVTDGVNQNGRLGPILTKPTLPTSALIIGENPNAIPVSVPTMVSADGHYAFASAQTLGEFAIEKLLTQVLIGLGGSTFISDPEGALEPGESQTFPIHVTEADRELEVIVFSNDADALDVRWVDLGKKPTHSEQQLQDAPQTVNHHTEGAQVVRGEGVLITRIPVPALPHPDRGHSPTVILSRTRPALNEETSVRYNLLVAAKTDLMFDAEASASGPSVGSDLLFSAVLTEYGLTWDRPDTSVHVELFHPDGFVQTLPLHEGTPGHFQANLRSSQAGAYTAHFVATGKSLLDRRTFQRECLRTVAVLPQGE